MVVKSLRLDASKKADRKFEKKLQFYSKVRENVATLSAKKSIEKKSKSTRRRQKKLKAYDLSHLHEFLPELKAGQKPAPEPEKVNCKSRQKLVLKEAKQLMTVISHPIFQSDPLAAIHQHLQNTQPAPEHKLPSKDDAKKKRKKKKKSSSGPQSMEL
ncbi:uncharacterized protein LOC130825058 [Amaranthus tricolor]|uniref:uncharacterized protein LOC130825058 n=1 Tax=Amaranthus tricolor TaxID=29722 RepID=UPI002590878D|nr:uncharacterized protein LOC130825058 [Amaranthus tricolor]